MGDIFITSYFAQYFNGEERRYIFYDNLYDENGIINDEVLTLTLKKLNKFLKSKSYNIFILDPNSYIEKFNSKEDSSMAMLYLDRTKFKSIIDPENSDLIFNFDLKTIEAFRRASLDLGVHFNLYSFYDLLKDNTHEGKYIYMILEKEFYFLMIIDKGKVVRYFYDDRTYYNERAKNNLEGIVDNITEDEIYEGLDFELLGSVLGGVLEELDNPNDFTLKLIPYEISDDTIDYIRTFAFKDINIIKYFDIPRENINHTSNFLKLNRKISLKGTFYIAVVVILFAILSYEIYFLKTTNSRISDLKVEYQILENQRIDYLIKEDEIKKRHDEKISFLDDYNQLVSEYKPLNYDKIIDIIEELNLRYEIKRAFIESEQLVLLLTSEDELDNKYNDKVTRIASKGNTKEYELRFEVGTDEYEW